jgi:hypothetical protein
MWGIRFKGDEAEGRIREWGRICWMALMDVRGRWREYVEREKVGERVEWELDSVRDGEVEGEGDDGLIGEEERLLDS